MLRLHRLTFVNVSKKNLLNNSKTQNKLETIKRNSIHKSQLEKHKLLESTTILPGNLDSFHVEF